MGTTTNKLSYLTETKEKLAEKIIDLGGDITEQTTFREYANELQTVYNNAPKVSAEGSNIKLENCTKGKMVIQPKGNTEQNDGASLDNPQTIKNVTGNNKVKISGKNLLSNNFEDYTIGNPYGYYKIIDNIGSHNLVMSLIDEDTSIDMSGIYFGFSSSGTDASGGVYWIMDNGNKKTKKLITNSMKYFSFYPGGPVTFNKIFSRYKIQVEIRNDVNSTDYEPYIEPIEKELNLTSKNVLQLKKNYTWTSNGITVSTEDDDIITINGTVSSNLNDTRIFLFDNHYYVEAGETYTETIKYISGTITPSSNTSTNTGLFYLRNSATESGFEYQFNGRTGIGYLKTHDIFETITVLDTGSSTRNGYINSMQLMAQQGTVFNNYKIKIQLEKNNTPTEYEPYYNYELCKIGDYSDLIFKNEPNNPNYNNTLIENAWYKKENIFKIILDGTEEMGIYTWREMKGIRIANVVNTKYDRAEGICTHSKKVGNYYENNAIWLKVNITSMFWIGILDILGLETVEQFSNWLQNQYQNKTPVIVQYITTNITYKQITEETLINQLESLNRTIIQVPTINIETESEENNAQLIVNASALKSSEDNEN